MENLYSHCANCSSSFDEPNAIGLCAGCSSEYGVNFITNAHTNGEFIGLPDDLLKLAREAFPRALELSGYSSSTGTWICSADYNDGSCERFYAEPASGLFEIYQNVRSIYRIADELKHWVVTHGCKCGVFDCKKCEDTQKAISKLVDTRSIYRG